MQAQLTNSRASELERTLRLQTQHYAALAGREGAWLNGAGRPDQGAGQLAALQLWRLESENILLALDTATERVELDWLLPIAHGLRVYLEFSGAVRDAFARYTVLLASAVPRLQSARLEFECRLGQAQAALLLGDYDAMRPAATAAARVAETDLDADATFECEMLLAAAAVRTHGVLSPEVLGRLEALAAQTRNPQQAARYHLSTAASSAGAAAETAARLSEDSFREVGDLSGAATALDLRGRLAMAAERYAEAQELFLAALELVRELGQRSGEARTLHNLAMAYEFAGSVAAGREHYLQARTLNQQLGNRAWEAYDLHNLAFNSARSGDYAEALTWCADCLSLFVESRTLNVLTCACAAMSLILAGRLAAGARVLESSLSWTRTIGYEFDTDEQSVLDAAQARLAQAASVGELDAAELARWQAASEEWDVEALVTATLNELESLAAWQVQRSSPLPR